VEKVLLQAAGVVVDSLFFTSAVLTGAVAAGGAAVGAAVRRRTGCGFAFSFAPETTT